MEKSAIQLVNYDKTDLLQPGASQTLEIPVRRYFLASYDTNGAETYVLSAGDYYLSIGSDAHDALNNVLAAKGYTTANGMTADGDASKTYTWNQELWTPRPTAFPPRPAMRSPMPLTMPT